MEVTRTAFYDYLERKNKPWKYQILTYEMVEVLLNLRVSGTLINLLVSIQQKSIPLKTSPLALLSFV